MSMTQAHATAIEDIAYQVQLKKGLVENAQRCLAFLETLRNCGVITEGEDSGRGIMIEVKKACAIIRVRDRDVDRLWWVMRSAWRGDKAAVECVKKARGGECKSGESTHTLWKSMKRNALKAMAEKPAPPPEPRHPHEPKIKAAIKAVSKIKTLTSDGQIALALVEEALQSGVYALGKEALRGTNVLLAEKAKPLGIAMGEVRACLTLLRTHPELVDDIRSGIATSEWTLSHLVYGRAKGKPVREARRDEDEEDIEGPTIDLDGFDLDSFVESAQERVKTASREEGSRPSVERAPLCNQQRPRRAPARGRRGEGPSGSRPRQESPGRDRTNKDDSGPPCHEQG